MTYTHERTPTDRHTEYIQQHKHNVQMHSVTYYYYYYYMRVCGFVGLRGHMRGIIV